MSAHEPNALATEQPNTPTHPHTHRTHPPADTQTHTHTHTHSSPQTTNQVPLTEREPSKQPTNHPATNQAISNQRNRPNNHTTSQPTSQAPDQPTSQPTDSADSRTNDATTPPSIIHHQHDKAPCLLGHRVHHTGAIRISVRHYPVHCTRLYIVLSHLCDNPTVCWFADAWWPPQFKSTVFCGMLVLSK